MAARRISKEVCDLFLPEEPPSVERRQELISDPTLFCKKYAHNLPYFLQFAFGMEEVKSSTTAATSPESSPARVDIFQWIVTIDSPPFCEEDPTVFYNCLYGLRFQLSIDFPQDYPFKPPKYRFSKLWERTLFEQSVKQKRVEERGKSSIALKEVETVPGLYGRHLQHRIFMERFQVEQDELFRRRELVLLELLDPKMIEGAELELGVGEWFEQTTHRWIRQLRNSLRSFPRREDGKTTEEEIEERDNSTAIAALHNKYNPNSVHDQHDLEGVKNPSDTYLECVRLRASLERSTAVLEERKKKELGTSLMMVPMKFPDEPENYPLERHSTNQLFIKTLTGKTVTIIIPGAGFGNLTVGEAMFLFKEREGLSPSQQRWVHMGKQLEPMRKLVEYNIREPIHLVLRLRGCGSPDFLGIGQPENWSPAITVSKSLLKATQIACFGLGYDDSAEPRMKNPRLAGQCPFGARGFCRLCRISSFPYGCFQGDSKTPDPLTEKEFEMMHWKVRSVSPSPSALWSPETDWLWPLLFRKNIRYLLKIVVRREERGKEEKGDAKDFLPHDLVAAIARFL